MKTASLLILLALAGCANYRPMVDMRGVDSVKYESDLRECQQYAQQTYGPGSGAAVGAGVGALLGFLVNRAAGSDYDSGAGARVGAVLGATGGAGADSEMTVIKRCMMGRGYSVLQ